jgi:hypothetical protein
MITAALIFTAGSCYFASADDDYEARYPERYHGMERQVLETPQPALYKKECGSCHMAYQPGLLPQRSWKKMMTTLEDHFGTDASLEPEDRIGITAYLTANAADIRPAERHMVKIASSVSPDAPMQMTKSRYFVREHREIPIRYISQPEVKSLANCNACHQNAESGDYRERGIFIPNYGRWDD